MKTIFQNIKDHYKLVLVTLIIGLTFGWLFFHSADGKPGMETPVESHEEHNHKAAEPTIWTCSMHPQIKQDKPGLCPICAMDLIPLAPMHSGDENESNNLIMMSESAMQLANIQTTKVASGIPHKAIYLQGKVQADERNIAELTARFGGRIEKLFINFTGQNVNKGEKLATIYSPDLLAAQRELLEAAALKENRPSLYQSAKSKLKLWDITDDQINGIEQKGEPQAYFDVQSPISGTVAARHVSVGNYIKEGSPLFKVVDLNKVWVLFDAYENDLPWLNEGQSIDFTLQALPGKKFTARVDYIDPFINAQTRVAQLRVEVPNQTLDLKPEMFTNGIVDARIPAAENNIMIPKSAVLWTGKRAIVYVKVPNDKMPSFAYREIILGPEAGNFYVVNEGLHEGEEIATNGVFKIDAAAQLSGLQSMMNTTERKASTGHNHGEMDRNTNNPNDLSGMNLAQEQVLFKVAGNCDMCKKRIETAAESTNGVISAMWDTKAKIMHLTFDATKTSPEAVQKAIAKVGHDTEKYKADEAVYNALPGCCLYERLNDQPAANKAIKEVELKVAGNCGMCKKRIETAANSVNGVSLALWDKDTKVLALTFDTTKTTTNEVQKAIAKVGHDTEKYKADDAVYKQLHECCLYKRDVFKY